jgi:gas vesicle protein
MEPQDNEKSVMVSVLAGIGIGVIVGAIAGLLFAPRTGTETRETIGTTLKDLGNKIADLSQEVTTKVKTVVEAGKQTADAKTEGAAEEPAASA